MKNCLTLFVAAFCAVVVTGDYPLTVEQIFPPARHNLTYFNVTLKKESRVLLGCNMTHPKNKPSDAFLRWEYKVMKGNVRVDNSTSTYRNNQINITLSYDTRRFTKSSVRVTCLLSNNRMVYNSTWFLIHNSGIQVSPISLLITVATAGLVVMRSSLFV